MGTKTAISVLLSALTNTKLLTLLDLDSADSSYCSLKDMHRHGQQHIECLAVIFSGSLNDGNYYFDDDRNPFHLQPEGRSHAGVNPSNTVAWKTDWARHFPTMSELESNASIPSYLFTRGFIKKTSRTPASASLSSSSSASASASSSSSIYNSSCDLIMPLPLSPFLSNDYEEDGDSNYHEVFNAESPTERQSSRSSFQSGDITEFYVLDRIKEENRGFCSILVAGSTPLEMEFNLDETCSTTRNFNCLPGTHRWLLCKDMTKGDLTVPRGTHISITSIRADMKVICCLESFSPADVLFDNTTQLYKLHRDYFRIPAIKFSSPVSIDG